MWSAIFIISVVCVIDHPVQQMLHSHEVMPMTAPEGMAIVHSKIGGLHTEQEV